MASLSYRKRLWYPSIKDIKLVNKKMISDFRVTKAEKSRIYPLGEPKLKSAIIESKDYEGDIYDKAAILLRGINQAHAFESANKRTAYFISNMFLGKNRNYLMAKKREKQKEFALKVRQGDVSDKEISSWLEKGK